MVAQGCRISKVRMKSGGVIIPLPSLHADQNEVFISTLLWLLDKARSGEVEAYAVAFCVEDKGGSDDRYRVRWVEGAYANDLEFYRLSMVGTLDRMKAKWLERCDEDGVQWNDAS